MQSMLHLKYVCKRNEVSRVYFLWTWTIQHANCSAVSPGEGQGRLLTSALVPFQKRRSSTRRGCSPSPASASRCLWSASCVWWPTAKPSKRPPHPLPLAHRQPGRQAPLPSLEKRGWAPQRDLLLIFFLLSNPFWGPFLITYIRKLCLFVWKCSEDFW